MQDCIFPKEIIDEIFKKCDSKTRINIKRTAKLYNESYKMIIADPINYTTIRQKAVLYYNKKPEKTIYVSSGYNKRIKKVINCFLFLVNKYNLNKKSPIIFRIKYEEYGSIKYLVEEKYGQVQIKVGKKLLPYYVDHMPRFFTMIDGKGNQHGRYQGSNPAQAARKAFSKFMAKKNVDDVDSNFVLKEVTRWSDKKYYYFSGKRIKINPRIVGHITYNYKNIVTKRPLEYNFWIDNIKI